MEWNKNNNVGSSNVGDWNVGSSNVGSSNAGNWNVGDWNVGSSNVGSSNVGDWNAGNWNAGSRNVGNWNDGNWNVGYWNDGCRNVGNWNVGDWNVGSSNVGYFNTITPKNIFIFNKECLKEVWENSNKPSWIYFNLLTDELEWVNIVDMTEQQKIDNPKYHITEGFLLLKKSEYCKDEVYKKSAQKSWDETNHEDRMLTYKLPNFNADIAQEIFGIDFKAYLEQSTVKSNIDNNIITINGIKYKKVEA